MDELLDEIMQQEVEIAAREADVVLDREVKTYDNYMGVFASDEKYVQSFIVSLTKFFRSMPFIRRFDISIDYPSEDIKKKIEKDKESKIYGFFKNKEKWIWVQFDIFLLTPLEAVRFMETMFGLIKTSFGSGIYMNETTHYYPNGDIILDTLHYTGGKNTFDYYDMMVKGMWNAYDREVINNGYDVEAFKYVLMDLYPGEYELPAYYMCIGPRWLTKPSNYVSEKTEKKYTRMGIQSLRDIKKYQSSDTPSLKRGIGFLYDLSSEHYGQRQINKIYILKRTLQPTAYGDEMSPVYMVPEEPEQFVIAMDVSMAGRGEPPRRWLFAGCKFNMMSVRETLTDLIDISSYEVDEILESMKLHFYYEEQRYLEPYNIRNGVGSRWH